MKAAEVHNLKDDELVAKLIDAKQEAFNLRFRHATGELENTARLGAAKRDVARLLTVRQGARDRCRERDEADMSDDEKKKDETTEETPVQDEDAQAAGPVAEEDSSSSQAAGEEPLRATRGSGAPEADAEELRPTTRVLADGGACG